MLVMGRSHQFSLVASPPSKRDLIPSEASVSYIGHLRQMPRAGQAGSGVMTRRKQGLRQRHVMGTGGREAKASDQTAGGAGDQRMEAAIAADATAPPFVDDASQPPPRRLMWRTGTPDESRIS
jgi:hypothetical protein